MLVFAFTIFFSLTLGHLHDMEENFPTISLLGGSAHQIHSQKFILLRMVSINTCLLAAKCDEGHTYVLCEEQDI